MTTITTIIQGLNFTSAAMTLRLRFRMETTVVWANIGIVHTGAQFSSRDASRRFIPQYWAFLSSHYTIFNERMSDVFKHWKIGNIDTSVIDLTDLLVKVKDIAVWIQFCYVMDCGVFRSGDNVDQVVYIFWLLELLSKLFEIFVVNECIFLAFN